ncbi:hypothetical protein HK102_011092, partial [Quaeritorhiza haematococci]
MVMLDPFIPSYLRHRDQKFLAITTKPTSILHKTASGTTSGSENLRNSIAAKQASLVGGAGFIVPAGNDEDSLRRFIQQSGGNSGRGYGDSIINVTDWRVILAGTTGAAVSWKARWIIVCAALPLFTILMAGAYAYHAYKQRTIMRANEHLNFEAQQPAPADVIQFPGAPKSVDGHRQSGVRVLPYLENQLVISLMLQSVSIIGWILFAVGISRVDLEETQLPYAFLLLTFVSSVSSMVATIKPSPYVSSFAILFTSIALGVTATTIRNLAAHDALLSRLSMAGSIMYAVGKMLDIVFSMYRYSRGLENSNNLAIAAAGVVGLGWILHVIAYGRLRVDAFDVSERRADFTFYGFAFTGWTPLAALLLANVSNTKILNATAGLATVAVIYVSSATAVGSIEYIVDCYQHYSNPALSSADLCTYHWTLSASGALICYVCGTVLLIIKSIEETAHCQLSPRFTLVQISSHNMPTEASQSPAAHLTALELALRTIPTHRNVFGGLTRHEPLWKLWRITAILTFVFWGIFIGGLGATDVSFPPRVLSTGIAVCLLQLAFILILCVAVVKDSRLWAVLGGIGFTVLSLLSGQFLLIVGQIIRTPSFAGTSFEYSVTTRSGGPIATAFAGCLTATLGHTTLWIWIHYRLRLRHPTHQKRYIAVCQSGWIPAIIMVIGVILSIHRGDNDVLKLFSDYVGSIFGSVLTTVALATQLFFFGYGSNEWLALLPHVASSLSIFSLGGIIFSAGTNLGCTSCSKTAPALMLVGALLYITLSTSASIYNLWFSEPPANVGEGQQEIRPWDLLSRIKVHICAMLRIDQNAAPLVDTAQDLNRFVTLSPIISQVFKIILSVMIASTGIFLTS